MNKIAVVIAGSFALPSAFVVFRGIEESIRKAAKLGYDGVELALKNANEINKVKLSAWLKETNLKVSSISTGQIYADSKLMFTHPDKRKREQVIKIFRDIIDLASDFGQMVNIGRVRGTINNSDGGDSSVNLFIETARILCDYASCRHVTLVLEPVNRYELNFINSVEVGAVMLNKVSRSNLKLMPDVFHMNIEDPNISDELVKYIDRIGYIHLADSNRLAPGLGHIDFKSIFQKLISVNYDGWLSVEILPFPDPDTAAKQAIKYIKSMLITS
jgi:sugar phosphate isomerase/epimerase